MGNPYIQNLLKIVNNEDFNSEEKLILIIKLINNTQGKVYLQDNKFVYEVQRFNARIKTNSVSFAVVNSDRNVFADNIGVIESATKEKNINTFWKLITKKLNYLNEEERVIFYYKFIKHMPIRSISDKIGETRPHVKKVVDRIRTKLIDQFYLEKEG